MSSVLTAAMLLAGLGFFAFTMARRIAPLLALRRDDRVDRPGERVSALLAFGFGQKRLVESQALVRLGPRIRQVAHDLTAALLDAWTEFTKK